MILSEIMRASIGMNLAYCNPVKKSSTTPIVPQGTSMGATDDNSTGKEQETSAGNTTTPIVPQGTSMGNR